MAGACGNVQSMAPERLCVVPGDTDRQTGTRAGTDTDARHRWLAAEQSSQMAAEEVGRGKDITAQLVTHMVTHS